MTMADGVFITDKLDLAAVLVLAKFSVEFNKANSTIVQFVFAVPEDRAEDLEDVLADFDGFASKVEPRSFMQEITYLRKRVYSLVPPRNAPSA